MSAAESLPPGQQLMQCLAEAGLNYGREDSFKVSRGRLLAERLMLGVRTKSVQLEAALRIAARLGMPAELTHQVSEHWAAADVVLFGVEAGRDETVFKLYLEFWEQVRQQVGRTGSDAPLLLDLGFKWPAGGGARPRVARYVCHPLLSPATSIGRIQALYAGARGPTAYPMVVELIDRCAARRPGAPFIYLEAEEDGTPRCSFDINLYRAGLTLDDAADWLARLASHYGIDAGAMQALQAAVGSHPLGHISGGVDRHGDDFLTVYHEVEPLP